MRSRSRKRGQSKQTELGRRIASARAGAGLKPADLARALGVGNTQIWRWEKNGVTPETASLALIAHACGVTVDSLLADTPAPARAAS